MRENKKRKSAYAAVLLCMYLLGSICTLAFLPEINKFPSENEKMIKLIPVLLVGLESLIFSSMIGLVLLPLSTVFLGASCTMLLSVDKAHYLFAALAVLIPLSFVICSEGMEISWQLRHSMSLRRNSYRKKLFLSYSIMFIGMVVFALLCRNILTI